jgi:type IV fimbrial biogenesis protein FimT
VTGLNGANVHTDATQRAPPRSAGLARRTARGFTMTELVVTMAITAILVSVAVPAFNGLIATQRARVFASDLYATLAKTRSEAITLNNPVTLQANAGGWANGWQMLDANNKVLDKHAAATAVTIVGPATVTYRASGRLPAGAVAPMFVISTTSGATVNYQCVSVDLGGRPYMAAAAAC